MKLKNVLYGLLFITCSIVTNAQPKETIAGRYEDHGMWREHPYTMFNKRKVNWKLSDELVKIKSLIYAGQPDSGKFVFKNIYAQLYSEIYEAAQKPEPPNTGYASQKLTSPHAAWAKNNAFVFLVGLKYFKI